jgi:hypothetical protein
MNARRHSCEMKQSYGTYELSAEELVAKSIPLEK